MVWKATEDAYGRMMLDYFEGKSWLPEIVERDDGWIAVSSGPQLYFEPFESWQRHEQQALDYVHGRVLDAGCGAGRAMLELHARGFETLGIDISPLAVEVCRRRGLDNLHVRAFSDVDRSLGPFDTLLMLGNNFGLFAGAKRARSLLQRLAKLMPADARIVACSRDIYLTDDPDHLAHHEHNRQRGRLPGQNRLRLRYRRLKTPWFDYLMVAPHELRDLLDGTAWRLQEIVEGDSGNYAAIIEKQH